MKRATLLTLPLLLVACAHQPRKADPFPELPRYALQSRLADVPNEADDEGGGGYLPVSYVLLSDVEGQAMAPVGSPSWVGSAYSLTLSAPSGSNGLILQSGANIVLNGVGGTRNLKWNNAATRFEFNGIVYGSAFTSPAAAASNAFEVQTNGAFIDFGAGTNDKASSDGTTVTFAGPLATSSTLTAAGGKMVVSSSTGRITFDATDNSGSPGACTINKPSGQCAVAAAANSVVITNSLVSTTSVIGAYIQTNDSTCNYVDSIVPASGSFTVLLSANCNAATKIGFVVFN